MPFHPLPNPTTHRLPTPNVSPKTPRGYLVKTLATYGRLNSAFPRKPREMRGGGKWEAIRGFASEPCLACSFPLECRVCLQPTATAHRCPLINITCTLYSTTYICQDNVTCRNKMFCQPLLNLFSPRQRVKLNHNSAVHNWSVFCMILFFRPLEESARRNPETRKKREKEIKILSTSQPTHPKIAKIKTGEEKKNPLYRKLWRLEPYSALKGR